MESLIKNNHCGFNKINHDYFLCRFHVINIYLIKMNNDLTPQR